MDYRRTRGEDKTRADGWTVTASEYPLAGVSDPDYNIHVLNYIWLALVLLAVAIGGWSDRFKGVSEGALDGAKTAVTIALGLIGIMALWLGVMRLAERAGLVQRIARGLRPIIRRLFPDVPPEHSAMGSMVMNMSANMLGLGNAATPLGLRAVRDFESLDPRPGVATNAMRKDEL